MDRARALLAQSGLNARYFLPFALETAARLLQVTPVEGVTPYQRRFGSRPDVSYVRTFGCRVLVLNPSKYPKYGPRARPGILLSFGMPQYSFGTYKVWDVRTRRVVHSRDVVFFEDKTIQDTETLGIHERADSDDADNSDEESIEEDASEDGRITKRKSARIRSSEYNANFRDELKHRLDEIGSSPNTPTWLASLAVAATARAEEGSKTVEAAPCVLEPKSYKQASTMPLWVEAMEAEIEALRGKETFEVVERKPGIKPIPCKWVFKLKAHEARAKAQIIVMGCFQDTSSLETFAPTAAHTTTKMVVFYAARRSWRLECMDIDAAFLNGEAPPETYVLPPPGYREEGICGS